MNKPKTRNENIVVQEMENEILIYDLKTNKAFCLNETSALIYLLCDGKQSIAEIGQSLSKKLNQPIGEDFVWLALDSFKKDNLLENNDQFEINFNGLSRRQVIKKIGFASLATLPVIASVIAPQAVQAASCVGLFQPCSPQLSVGNCCSGLVCFAGGPPNCQSCIAPGGASQCGTPGKVCSNGVYCCSGMASDSTAFCGPGLTLCLCD